MKTLTTLLNTPNIPGVEANVLAGVAGKFPEKYLSNGEVYLYDPWWGTLPLTIEAYNAVTYAAYTAAAPPAFDHIMFNADRSGFKCGSGNWMGVIQALLMFYGQ